MKRIIINENQRGYRFRDGRLIGLLSPGKHYLRGGEEAEIVSLKDPLSSNRCALAVLLADRAIAGQTIQVKVGDQELALHYINGRFLEALRAGEYAFW